MNHYDDLQRFQEKNADAKPQISGSFFASRHAGTWGLGDPQSAESRRRETRFSGAGRVGLRAAAAARACGSLPACRPCGRRASITSGCASPPSYCRDPTAGRRTCNAGTCRSGASDDGRALAAATPVPEPVMAPPPRMAPRPAPGADNYAHLFAAKTAEPVAKNKDQPLKSLLERIATCR